MASTENSQLWLELDSGMQALLTTQMTRILHRVVSGLDLILVCLALLMCFRAMPRLQISTRMAKIGIKLYTGLLLNSVLVSVQVPDHQAMTLLNLLAVHFLSKAVTEQSLSESSRFLIVTQLVNALKGWGESGTAFAWCIGHIPFFHAVDPEVSLFFRMASVDLGLQWIMARMPGDFKFAGMLLILFFCTPLLDVFPALGRLYKFAMFSVADDMPFQGLGPWIQGFGFLYASKRVSEATFQRIAKYASVHVLANGVLHATQPLVDKDPILVTVNLIVFLSVLVNYI